MVSSSKFLLFNLFVLLFIVSCGGGGGGGGTPAPEPSPTASLSSSSSSVLIDTVVTLTWSSTNTTSCSASGTWTGTKATSGTQDVTIATPGNNQFTITCSGTGGSRAASVTIEGYRNTDGVSVDGYIRQADIFIDTNDSYTADLGEDTTTSDNDGKFTIKYSDGNLISLGGTDLDSGNALDNLLIVHKLTGHSNFKAVTPVTSVAAFMADASLVNAALGIDASLDIATVDPVASKGDVGINDYLFEKGNQLTVLAYVLQNITNNLNTTTETTQDYFKAIAEELDTEYAATSLKIDIETEAFITKVIDNVISAKALTVAEEARTNLVSALASVMPVIEIKSSDSLSTAVFDFATSTLQTDVQALANGTATTEIISSYQTDILNYIATDQNVDADELAPEITAMADEASLDEDGNIDISPLINDSYLTSAPISITATNGTSGLTSVTNNIITYSPNADFNGSDAFDYSITQGNKTSSANVAIIVNSINDAPTFNNLLSTYSVPENQTAITTVVGVDVDEDTLTIALSGTDLASFNLSSANVLTFVEAPDYETKTSYAITLSVTDEIETTSKDITILVSNLNDVAPVISSAANFSVAENQTAIGTVTATDTEGDTLIYSVSGTELAISSSGILTFVSAPDFETKTSYTAKITVNDGVNNTTQDITVSVTNVNDIAPVISSAATFNAAENQTAIGTIAATDAEGDTLTYSISGNDIAITGSGIIAFINPPDYENKSSYTTKVTVSDGVNLTTQDIVISIININDVAPVLTSSATFSVTENQTAIGTVIATDEEGDTLTYSVSGTELAISSSGILTFVTAPDYESKSSYAATVTVNDGVNSTTQDIVISITDVNEAPVFTSLATFSVVENQTAIGTVTATDPDGDTLSYNISGSELEINISTGMLSFKTAPDFETKSLYTATLTVSEGGFNVTQDIVINVSNVNEAPALNVQSMSADENQINISGSVIVNDPEGDALNYSVSGNDFNISNAGIITFKTAPDYETKNYYEAEITVSDAQLSSSATIKVNINNVNEAPIFTSSATFSVAENQTAIGTVTASDVDNGSSLTYSISGSELAISSTGVISFSAAPNYETKTSYTATVSVSDGGLTTTQDLTINVNNVLEDVIAYTADISDGTNSVVPKLTASITIDELTLAKKVYIQLSSVASSQEIDCDGQKTFEMSKTNSTLWEVSEDLYYGLREICKYHVTFFINPFNIDYDAIPPTDGQHMQSNNKRLGSIDSVYKNYLEFTFLYEPIATSDTNNLISISNPRSDNTIEKDDFFGIYFYLESGNYPSGCTTSTININGYGNTPLIARLDSTCSNAIIAISEIADNRLKYQFSIYSLEELDNIKSYLFGARKDENTNPDSYGYSSREGEMRFGTIDPDNNRIADFSFYFDKEWLPNQIAGASFDFYATAKSLGRLGGGSQAYTQVGYTLEANSNADVTAPLVNSITLENYQNTQYPQREYIKVKANITNNNSNGGSLTAIKDLWITLRAPNCRTSFIYVRDELDGKLATNVNTLEATFPVLTNNYGTYEILDFNINDWGFAESYYMDEKSYGDNAPFTTHPNIGDKIKVGEALASCPLFSNFANNDQHINNVNINENETNLGTYTASGSSVDTIKYSIGQYRQYTFHQLVSIDSSTGALTANEPFDYDSGGTGGYLTIYAESTIDPSIKNSLNVRILANNVDDVPPIFNEGMVGCDISGYSTSSSCSIATGEFAITSGLLSNPDGDDEESSIQVGGTDADLIYIENTSGNDWLITLRSNADISQKNQYQFSLTYSDNGINTRTDNITLTVTN